MPGVVSRGRGRRAISEINMVPFIDVMLVLLIIFMVSAPLITTGVVDLPSMGKAKQRPPSVIEVIVGTDEHLKIRVDKADPEADHDPATGRARRTELQAGRADVPVIIAGDKSRALREHRQGDGHAPARRRAARGPGRQAGGLDHASHEQRFRPAVPMTVRRSEEDWSTGVTISIVAHLRRWSARWYWGHALAQFDGGRGRSDGRAVVGHSRDGKRRRRWRHRRPRRPRPVPPPPPPVETPKPPDIVDRTGQEAAAQADASAASTAEAGTAQARARCRRRRRPRRSWTRRRSQKLHDENLKRMMGQMNATGQRHRHRRTTTRHRLPTYAGRIIARLRPKPARPDRFSIPGNPATVEVTIHCAPDGTIISRNITKPSGIEGLGRARCCGRSTATGSIAARHQRQGASRTRSRSDLGAAGLRPAARRPAYYWPPAPSLRRRSCRPGSVARALGHVLPLVAALLRLGLAGARMHAVAGGAVVLARLGDPEALFLSRLGIGRLGLADERAPARKPAWTRR